MFTIYYNKKLTNLQLKLFNYLAEEHNPALEFFISFLILILEKSIKIAEVIKDILIVPIFQMFGIFIMLVLLLFNLFASIPRINNTIVIPTTTTTINPTETNFKNHILDFINASDNIPPPILIKQKIQLNKAVKLEEKEKVIDEINNISNPYVKEATKKKREQLENIAKYKGTLLDLDKIKSCATDLTIPNTSKPIIRYCNNRFCPVCSSIKAGKNADIIKKVLFKARENKKVLLYGTFTTRNVTADNLTAEIEKINTAFTKTLTVPKKMKNIVGYVKKLEIKYNPIQQDYNVHIHTVIAVINYYKEHITKEEFYTNFKKYLKDDSIIPPDIKKIGATDEDITKVANYLSKEDLIQNLLFADEVSDNIFNAVKNKRLLEFCLSFRELKKEFENVIDLNKINKNKNKLPLLTTLTWDNNKKIYIN